jgi:serine/threonine-protein kinase
MVLKRLEKYELLEEVGQGGMATVFRGYDTALHREVAVKVLHPHLAAQPESKQRLEREAQAVAKLRHENILEIFDYSGPDASESYIVTEFIRGPTLKGLLDKGGIPFPEIAAMIGVELTSALAHAHARGIIHRDLKPENVMVQDDGLVKLMDFGIAQVIDKERMTVTGQLLGSPAYMSPEQVFGRPLDVRSDVFSVGTLLYQLATGQLPFPGKNPHEVLKRIGDGRFASAQQVRPQVGERLGRILARALAPAPEARYPEIAPMLADLSAYLAELDLADARAELGRYFAEPTGYAAALPARLLSTLRVRARERLAAGQRAQALELISRALTLAPDDPEASAILATMERRRRLGMAALVIAVAVPLAVAGAAVLAWGTRPAAPTIGPPAPTPPIARVAPTPPSSASTAAPSAPPTPPVIAQAAPPQASKRPERAQHAAPAAPRTRTVRIESFPKAVHVELDGRPVPFDDADPQVEVPVGGSHHLRFSNPACYPEEKEVTQDLMKVHLRWKPARIQIESNAPGAIFLVNGRPVSHGLVETPAQGDSRQVVVPVEASAPGHEPRRMNCDGLAGEQRVCRINLEKAAE